MARRHGRVAALLLALALVLLAVAPAGYAFAEEKVSTDDLVLTAQADPKAAVIVATIGDSEYTSLDAAQLAVANDGTQTIKLVRDVNLGTGAFVVSKWFTLDLNGHTISGSGVDDLDENGNSYGATVRLTSRNGSVGRLTVVDSEGFSGQIRQNDINAPRYGIRLTGEGTELTVNDVLIEAYYCIGADSASSTVNVGSYATLQSNSCGITSCGTVNVSGGIISGWVDAGSDVKCIDVSGDSVSITGGKFMGAVNSASATKFITGGTFLTTEGSEALALNPSYLANCYVQDMSTGEVSLGDYVATIGDVPYASLADAQDDVSNDGTQTISLAKDIDLGTGSFVVSKWFTLDLNGHTLSGTGEDDNRCAVVWLDSDGENVGKLTVVDSSQAGDGAILQSDSSNGHYGVRLIGGRTKLNVEGGTIKGPVGINGMSQRSTITISGGTVEGTGSNGTAVSTYGTLNVSGGTFWGGSCGICIEPDGTGTIASGSISGGVGVEAKTLGMVSISGDVTISGSPSVVVGSQSSYGETVFAIEGGRFSDAAGNGEGFTLPKGKTLQRIAGEEWYTLQSDGSIDFGTIEYKASLSLDERIAVNLYMNSLPEGTDPADYAVKYWVTGDESGAAEAHPTETGTNFFRLADFAAKEMCDPVHIRVYYQGTLIKSADYSVRDYCDKKIEESDDAELVALCQATLDYGAYAQKHFNHNTDDPANKNHREGTEERVAAVAVPADYAASSSGSVSALKSMSASVSLDSQAVISFYLTPAAADFDMSIPSVYVDGNSVREGRPAVALSDGATASSTVLEDGRLLVQIKGIAPKHYDHAFRVDVTHGQERKIVYYSVLSYAYSKQGVAKKGLGSTCKALYNYHLAAKAYL